MKIIVAGSRDFIDRDTIRSCIESSGIVGQMTELVHGGCRGVDSVAHDLFEGIVPIKVFPADWKTHGKAAGPIRNRQMAEYADALIAIARPGSRGTGCRPGTGQKSVGRRPRRSDQPDYRCGC